jgi:hypothetical protein
MRRIAAPDASCSTCSSERERNADPPNPSAQFIARPEKPAITRRLRPKKRRVGELPAVWRFGGTMARDILRPATTTAAAVLLSLVAAFAAVRSLPKTSQELCALLSPQVATEVLKGPAAPNSVQLSDAICMWIVPSLRTRSPFLTYTVVLGTVGGTSGVTRPVKGVGDMAFWNPRGGSMLASWHGVAVEVHLKAPDGAPIDDEASAAAVARDILSHF